MKVTSDTTSDAWAFSSTPKVLEPTARKARYKHLREDTIDDRQLSFNIMSDPRVMRGPTVSVANAFSTTARRDESSASAVAHLRGTKHCRLGKCAIPLVKGQLHAAAKHDELRKEVTRALIETENLPSSHGRSCQTDPFYEQPPELPTTSRAAQVDKARSIATSMEAEQPFHFDEVDPLVEVLAGKCLQQALLEVEQEDELYAINSAALSKYQEQENEVQRIGEVERVRIEAIKQKQSHTLQARTALEHRISFEAKVASLQLIQSQLPSILNACCSNFESKASLIPPEADDIYGSFLPNLFSGVGVEIQRRTQGCDVLDAIISDIIKDCV